VWVYAIIVYMSNAFLSAYFCSSQGIFIMLAFGCVLYFPPFFLYMMVQVFKTPIMDGKVVVSLGCFFSVFE
jgi:hypothetical protein